MCHPKNVDGDDMGPTGLCVGRAVTLAAAQAGTVVLDAGKRMRVLFVNGSGVELAGLNITGGKPVSARLSNSGALLAFSRARGLPVFTRRRTWVLARIQSVRLSSRSFDRCLV